MIEMISDACHRIAYSLYNFFSDVTLIEHLTIKIKTINHSIDY